jgi:hypothetical protein
VAGALAARAELRVRAHSLGPPAGGPGSRHRLAGLCGVKRARGVQKPRLCFTDSNSPPGKELAMRTGHCYKREEKILRPVAGLVSNHPWKAAPLLDV